MSARDYSENMDMRNGEMRNGEFTMDMTMDIKGILEEDARRRAGMRDGFDPVSGRGSVGKRFLLKLSDYQPMCSLHPEDEGIDIPHPENAVFQMWLPEEMRGDPLVERLIKSGSFERGALAGEDAEGLRRRFTMMRLRCDFPYWCAVAARIKPKGGGDDVPFMLNRPQRRLVERFEESRVAGKPIRVILLKARQWGGSLIYIYSYIYK